MSTAYATPVKRFSSIVKRHDAEDAAEKFAAEKFAAEVGHKFICISKDSPTSPWTATLGCDDGMEVGAAIVKCPHCGEINVCWGEFGDPAAELAICTECGENYTTEPF